jgi:hypothetical protein
MRRSVHAASLLVLLFAAPARAEVLVSGTRDAINVEISDASVDEVLAALSAKFALSYRSGAPLDKRLTGTHDGSLQRVIAGVLTGYDFVVKTSRDGLEVTVYGAGTAGRFIGATRPVEAIIPTGPAPVPSAKARREERRKRQAN